MVVQDHGTPPRSATMSVNVRVLDLNDNAPSFAQASYVVEVPEDLPVGALVLQLVAEDPDEGTNGQVSYYLGNESLGMFQIEPQSGRIRSAQALDRERHPSYSFLAKAVDSAPWEPKNTAVRVTVTVRDVNDHAPAFLHSPLTVNLSRHTPLKQVVATMRAEDRDAGANASILYRLATPNSAFAINSYTGDIQLLQPLGSLGPRQRTLFVLATDLGQPALSSTGVVVIHLQEEPYRGLRFPRSTSDVALPENAAPGTAGQSDRQSAGVTRDRTGGEAGAGLAKLWGTQSRGHWRGLGKPLYASGRPKGLRGLPGARAVQGHSPCGFASRCLIPVGGHRCPGAPGGSLGITVGP